MFVIPSKYIENVSPIHKCIDAIINFHPNEKILIVDSYSDDDSYLKEFEKIPNVIISKYKNKYYEFGAFYYAYKEFPNEHYYALIQDSIILSHSWEEFLHNDVTYNLLYFDEPSHSQGMSYNNEWHTYITDIIKKTKYDSDIKGTYFGIFGMLAIYKQDVIQKIIEKGLFEVALSIDKFGACMNERIFGICLSQDGYDIINNSIEGNFWDKSFKLSRKQLKYFYKIYGGRV